MSDLPLPRPPMANNPTPRVSLELMCAAYAQEIDDDSTPARRTPPASGPLAVNYGDSDMKSLVHSTRRRQDRKQKLTAVFPELRPSDIRARVMVRGASARPSGYSGARHSRPASLRAIPAFGWPHGITGLPVRAAHRPCEGVDGPGRQTRKRAAFRGECGPLLLTRAGWNRARADAREPGWPGPESRNGRWVSTNLPLDLVQTNRRGRSRNFRSGAPGRLLTCGLATAGRTA